MSNLENNTAELQELLQKANALPTDISGQAVLFTEQTLTDEQKAQARENIGVDAEDLTPPTVTLTEEYIAGGGSDLGTIMLPQYTLTVTQPDGTSKDAIWMDGAPGADGGVYLPSVSEEGVLSWKYKDSSFNPLPSSVNIKGSDANVTAENITSALGYTPANQAETLSVALQTLTDEQKEQVRTNIGVTIPDPVGAFPNGSWWAKSNISGATKSVYYYEGMFVAGGDSGIYYSPDGSIWALSNIATATTAIYNHNGTWLANVGDTIYYSADGKSWTSTGVSGASLENFYSANGQVLIGSTAARYISTDGIAWTTTSQSNGLIKAWKHANNLYVGAGGKGLRYSTDGVNWTASNVSSGTFYTIEYFKGVWVAGGNMGMFYSDDGKNWTKITTVGTMTTPRCVVDDLILASASNSDNGIYYSTDGKVWAQSNLTNTRAVNIVYGNGRFVAYNGLGGGLYYSEDGITWLVTNNIEPCNTSYHARIVCYGDGVWAAASNSGLHYSVALAPLRSDPRIDQLSAEKATAGNIDVDYVYDADSSTNYTLVRVYRDKLDGSKQYPFVYAPNENGIPILSSYDVALAKGFAITINAGMGAGWKGADGMLIQNSQVLQHGPSIVNPDCRALTVNTDGDLGYAAVDADADELVSQGIVSAVCGFMPIVVDYSSVPESEWNNIEHYDQAAQRQIIGQFANGDYAIISCDGRGFNNSTGWTIVQAQRICLKHGLKFAYNLDGGGSTETVIQKKQLNLMYDGGTGRKIPVCIAFTGGTEAPAVETATRYGVLCMMTNATISGCPYSVLPGEGFTATVTPDSGGALDSITVTMRGVDITAQAVNGNTVSVPAVTGKVVIVANAIVPNVPDGYTEVEYLESTGTQYIRTGIFAGTASASRGVRTTIDTSVQVTLPVSKRTLCGANPANYFGVTAEGVYECSSAASSIAPSADAFDHIFHDCSINDVGDATMYLYVNDVLAASRNANAVGDDGEIMLFTLGKETGVYSTNFNMSMKMKKFTITKNDVVVGEFIPCVRNSDNEPGMYDTVTQAFFTNDGTGEFLIPEAGDDLPDEYTEVEYLESDGNQYIFPGYACVIDGTTFELETEVQFTGSRTKRQLIGANGLFYFGITASGVFEVAGAATSVQPSSGAFDSVALTLSSVAGNGTATLSVNGEAAGTKNANLGSGAVAYMALFALCDGADNTLYPGMNAVCRLKRTVIKENGVVARTLVPCYRNSDNKPGMYELKYGRFYTNAGTGEFLYG